MPAGVDSNELLTYGRDRYSLTLGGGIGQLNGQAFRIGHLGSLNELEVMGMIGGIELTFADQNLAVKPGSGLLACQASFLADGAQQAAPPAALAAV
jgi:alanine-glyoxylate transaminase/serine-glyoxylate transaminase/serine-pyruvate transaminase